MRLIIKSVSEEVALRKNRKAVAVHKRCESSPKENFGHIGHLFASHAPVLNQNRKTTALQTNVATIWDASSNIAEALVVLEVVADHAGHALESLVVESAVVDDVGGADGHEGVELEGVGGGGDGDDAHHEASAAAIVQYFILILHADGEEWDCVDGLGCPADEVGVLPCEHVVIASDEVGVSECCFECDYLEPAVPVLLRNWLQVERRCERCGYWISWWVRWGVTVEHAPLPSEAAREGSHLSQVYCPRLSRV